MKKLLKLSFSLGILFFCQLSFADIGDTPPRDPVIDEAQLVEMQDEALLNQELRRLKDSGGSQIGVVTLNDLGGVPIESASIKITDKWKLGKADKDNGVLFIIAKADRALRIEVGQGLEGVLTDALSKRIIDRVVVPRFKEGRFSLGIVEGVATIVSITDPEFKFGNGSRRSGNLGRSGNHSVLSLITYIVIFVTMIVWSLLSTWRYRKYRGSSWTNSGTWGGWGSGGGFGGSSGGGFGGGFGGGGGGFSGGGASGRW